MVLRGLVCLVPWGICILHRPGGWRWNFIYYLLGVAWFLANLYWLWPLTAGGTIALVAFIGLYWMLFAWSLRRLVVDLRWPAMVAMPLAWVASEYLRATVFSGFPWFLLGNALAPRPVLIQWADLFGVWGLSAWCALTAGWIVDLLRLPLQKKNGAVDAQGTDVPVRSWRPRAATILGLSVAYGAITTAIVIYGFFRLGQNTQTPGPRVAVIQDSIPANN